MHPIGDPRRAARADRQFIGILCMNAVLPKRNMRVNA
jgi:hypothetical protein